MNADPIVEEIHEIRRRMLEECGGDLERLMDRLRQAEVQDKDRLVTLDELQQRQKPLRTAI